MYFLRDTVINNGLVSYEINSDKLYGIYPNKTSYRINQNIFNLDNLSMQPQILPFIVFIVN